MLLYFALFFLFLHYNLGMELAKEYRTFDGRNNNKKHPWWGSKGSHFSRLFPQEEARDTSSPIELSDLAKVRVPESQAKSLLSAGFGQFIAHDVGFMEP